MSATTTCPHCGGVTSAGAFCTQCGQALPAASPGGPRLVGGSDVAATSAGRRLQTEDLHKTARKAAGALLAVAILQAVFGGVIVAMLPDAVAQEQKTMLMVTVFGIAVIFFGLFLWARVQPFPAAIVGLVLFITIHLLDALADPTALVRGIIVKVIVIVILVQAIKAGAQHRRLLREQLA